METVCTFSITPLDRALLPQVQTLLAKRVELDSRRRLPKLWDLTDRLNRAERAPQAVQVRRRRRRSILGVLCWALGLFLLLPGLMEPQSLLVPLLTGAAAYGAGIAALWRHRRTLLGILSLLQGALLTFAGTNSETLGRFLFLGIFGLVLGLAALIYRPREDRTPFYSEADALLKRQESLQSPEHWQVSFTPSSLLLLSTGPEQEPERQEIPLSSLSWILETADLLAPIFENSILLLQKKDLLSGSLEELRTLLTERSVFVQAETN